MQAAETKRFYDIWKGDADFRQQFLGQPSAALLHWGLQPAAIALHPFCVEQHEQGNLLLAGLEDLAGMEAYRSVLQQRDLWLRGQYASGFSNSAFNSWRLRQINRFRSQVPNAWARRNPHLPFVVELTNGCSLACPFCAGAAQRLDPNIPAFSHHKSFFTGVLGRLQQTVGLLQAPGALYFFTEPFDHPEYEQYLAEAGRIWGLIPQTTTAAWFKDPLRTHRFIQYSAELGMPYNRFSINSKKLFHQCLSQYSPQELLNIPLVLNYPEAAGSSLYASGRGRQVDNAIQGSVACVSGFLFNLPLRKIRLIAPTLETQRWPCGYRVLEEAVIDSLDDLERFVQHCQQSRFTAVLHGQSPLELRSDLLLTQEEDGWFLVNTYRRFPLTAGEKSMIEYLPKVKTVNELLQYDIPGLTPNQAFARLQIWWANGILND